MTGLLKRLYYLLRYGLTPINSNSRINAIVDRATKHIDFGNGDDA